MNCFPLSETSSSGNPNLAKISVRALMTSREGISFKCTLPDKTNNNQCRSIWTFRWLDQRDPLQLLPKDHEVEALAEAVCIYSKIDSPRMLHNFWSFSLLHRPYQAKTKRVLRNCLVFTIPWCVSCASDRICFRRDCGTTIRLPLRIAPSRIDNSSFMRLHGSRSVSRDHFPLWIWASNLESVTSLLVSHLMSERVTAWRSDMFDMHVNKSYIIFANETGIWTIILLGWQSRHRICCGGVPRGGGGGYTHKLPIPVCAARQGRDF